MHSSHKGPTEPPYKRTGLLWLDDSSSPLWTLNIYDGSDWISLFEIDSSSNNFVLKGVKDGVDRSDGLNIGQIQSNVFNYLGVSSGTNDIIAGANPPVLSLVAGSVFVFIAGATNTGTVTLDIDGTGAAAVQNKGAPLIAGDITVNDLVMVGCNGTQYQLLSTQKVGTVVSLDTGTAADEVPTNADLGALAVLDTVSPSVLDDTSVTAGVYTKADITVDAQGRITSAADGTDAPLTEPIAEITLPYVAGTRTFDIDFSGDMLAGRDYTIVADIDLYHEGTVSINNSSSISLIGEDDSAYSNISAMTIAAQAPVDITDIPIGALPFNNTTTPEKRRFIFTVYQPRTPNVGRCIKVESFNNGALGITLPDGFMASYMVTGKNWPSDPDLLKSIRFSNTNPGGPGIRYWTAGGVFKLYEIRQD